MILILLCFILVTLKICYKIFTKYRYKFEPMHIFLLNYFIGVLLQLASLEMNAIWATKNPTSEHCWHFIVGMFSTFYHALSAILMQVDRFIAVKWAMHYGRLVNNRNSFLSIGFCAFLGIVIVLAVLLCDPDFTLCAYPPLLMTRTTGILFGGIPKLVAVVSTVGVLLFCLKTNKRLAKVLPAKVNLPKVEPPLELNVRRLEGHAASFVRNVDSEASPQ